MIHVFAGPSIGVESLREVLPDAQVHPPAHRGDVFHAWRSGARAVLLIDGYFDTVPSVWHKELLHVLANDVLVYGASSIGALRAAEMERFGMIGVGEVFEEVRRGLVDDDDVAVAHDPEEDGATPRSVAMVNVRWTLRSAVAEGVLGRADADALDRLAKSTYYAERTYRRLITEARQRALVDPAALDAFEAWVRHGAVDVKRRDALRAAERVRRDVEAGFVPAGRPAHRPTRYFHEFVAEESVRDRVRVDPWSVVDELRADPRRFAEVRAIADRRRACIELARAAGVRPDRSMIESASESVRRRLDLLGTEQFAAWLDGVGWTDDEYVAFLEREALCAWGEARLARLHAEDVLDVVRLSDEYATLRRGADDRLTRLAQGVVDDRLEVDDAAVRRRAMRQRLGPAFASDLGDHELAAALGLDGVVALEGFLRVVAATDGVPRPDET